MNFNEKIKQVLKKWTVLRYVDQYLDEETFDKLIIDLSDTIGKIVASNKNNALLNYDISDCIYNLLDKSEIEVDEYSCDAMADIIVQLYKEDINGINDYFNKIVGLKEAEIPLEEDSE